MPGTITVSAKQTFATMLLLSAAQKTKFGTDEPDISKSGEKKFAVECAVTYLAENGMRPVSEVISVGLIGGDLPTIPPGTPVEFDSLRCGVSAPEKREGSNRISGGRLYWMGSGLRPAQAQGFRTSGKPAENAA
jgi:hypothetical protein